MSIKVLNKMEVYGKDYFNDNIKISRGTVFNDKEISIVFCSIFFKIKS